LPRFNDSRRFPDSSEGHRLRMSNRKAISRKEIDSQWFFCGGRAGGDQLAGATEQISRGPCNDVTYVLREHTGWFFFYLAFYFSSSPCISLTAFSLSLSLSLLHSAFIIKIKCKIVPRTSFPNGIKLRALVSLFLYIITTRGRIDSSFLDRVVPSRFIYSFRANKRAVFRRFSILLFISQYDVKVLRAGKAICDPIFSSFKELRAYVFSA